AMALDRIVDLTKPLHVRQRPAERGEVAVGLDTEAATPPRQTFAGERVQLGVLGELLPLGLRRRRDVADPPLADDLLGPALHDPIVPAQSDCGSTSTTAVNPARRMLGAAAASRRPACAAIRRGSFVFATSCAR